MGLLKKAESFEKKKTVPQIQEIDGKKYYSTEELSKLTGKSAGAIAMKLTRDSSIGVLVNQFRYFAESDIEKLKPKPKPKKKTLKKSANKKASVNLKTKKQQTKMLWKISEYDNDLNAYVVKICSLTEEKAKFLETVWITQGRYVRATPHYTRAK